MKHFPSLLTSISPLRLPSLRKAHKGRPVGDHFPLKKERGTIFLLKKKERKKEPAGIWEPLS
jgi:hypothetical protein